LPSEKSVQTPSLSHGRDEAKRDGARNDDEPQRRAQGDVEEA